MSPEMPRLGFKIKTGPFGIDVSERVLRWYKRKKIVAYSFIVLRGHVPYHDSINLSCGVKYCFILTS